MALSRLSPENIPDELKRAELYRDIRNAEGFAYEVQPDETKRPELIAYRYYQTDELKWAVMIAAGLDDPRQEIEAGIKITLPSVVFIRERIKFYAEVE